MSKTNPRRIPCTQADVDRAKAQATDEALRLSLYITLYVLAFNIFNMEAECDDL